jgi:hypothetical protein
VIQLPQESTLNMRDKNDNDWREGAMTQSVDTLGSGE